MRGTSLPLFVAAVLLAGGGALWGQKSRDPDELKAQLGYAPADVAKLRNPYEDQAEAVLAGKKLFRRHCTECHGPEGRGQDKAPDLHAPVIQNAAPGALFWFLKNGNLREGMPSWSRLPDERLWQLVSYLKTLK